MVARPGAIVLVAGTSTRIRDVTGGLPKSFLPVGGESLIERTLRLLRGAGVQDVTLVTGFMAELFRDRFPRCRFVHNAAFERSNTSVSLHLAMARRGPPDHGPVLVINGDVYFAEGIVEAMLASPHDTLAAVQRHALTEEEVKVFVDGDRVTRIGKHLDEAAAFGEAFGVYLLGSKFARYLEQELRLLGNPTTFYEEAMDRLLQAGHPMHVHDVGDAVACEVDFPEDYAELCARVR